MSISRLISVVLTMMIVSFTTPAGAQDVAACEAKCAKLADPTEKAACSLKCTPPSELQYTGKKCCTFIQRCRPVCDGKLTCNEKSSCRKANAGNCPDYHGSDCNEILNKK